MKCPVCGYEYQEKKSFCPSCGSNVLRVLFYRDQETRYNDERVLFNDLDNNKISIAFKRASEYELATRENRWLVFFHYIFAILFTIVLVVFSISNSSYWALIFIPFLFVYSMTRAKVGYLLVPFCLISVFFFPNWVTLGLVLCCLMRAVYTIWLDICHVKAVDYLKRNLDSFYVFWYNNDLALKIDGKLETHWDAEIKRRQAKPDQTISSLTRTINKEASSPKFKYCANCGFELTADTVFCGNCGKKINYKIY